MRITATNLNKIKLIIWDLDETFWNGTLSDNTEVAMVHPIITNIQLIKSLTDRGIVNSICSKNDKIDAERKLAEFGVLDYFVFNSINWSPKGKRVKSIIEKMSLRPANVLFIDDNTSNLSEVEYESPEIFTCLPEFIPEIASAVNSLGKDDTKHSRLKQYKLLETKRNDEENFSSNIDFLRSSNIQVIIKTENLESDADRIVELIQRSNQLNFTKKRIDINELRRILYDKRYNNGTVIVRDNYGEYGLVGFFSIIDGECEHFLFSCRTMGMGIEQFVYSYLKYPKLKIVGDVSGSVSDQIETPSYIKLVKSFSTEPTIKDQKYIPKILLKGPCDFEVMRVYLASGNYEITTEFNFVDNNGTQADFYNHSVQILNSLLCSQDKQLLIDNLRFVSDAVFDTSIFSGNYDVICISPLMDATLSVFEVIDTNFRIAYGLYNKPITDSQNWDAYVRKEIMTARSDMSIEEMEDIAKRLNKIDYGVSNIIENFSLIIKNIKCSNSKSKIVIMLLPELKFDTPLFKDKEVIHKQINDALRTSFGNDQSIYLLDINKYVVKQSDYFDNINHFSKMVYFKIAQELSQYLNNIGIEVRTHSPIKAFIDDTKRRLYKKFIMNHRLRKKIVLKLISILQK